MQIEYAALDAVCLLMLLDDLCQHARPAQSTQVQTVPPQQAQHAAQEQNLPLLRHSQQTHLGEEASSQASSWGDQSQHSMTPEFKHQQQHQTAATATTQGNLQQASRPQHQDADVQNAQTAQQSGDRSLHQHADKQNVRSVAEIHSTASQMPAEQQSRQVPTVPNSQTRQQLPSADEYEPLTAVNSTDSQSEDAAAGQNRQLGSGSGQKRQAGIDAAGQNRQVGSASDDHQKPMSDAWLEAEAHRAAVREAAELWGCRLEVTAEKAKPKAKKHMSRRHRAHMRHANEAQNQISDFAGMPLTHLPAHVGHF